MDLVWQKLQKDYIQSCARYTCHPGGRSLESRSKSGCLLSLFIASDDDSATAFCALLRLTRSRLSIRITITLLTKHGLWIFTPISRDGNNIQIQGRTDLIQSTIIQFNPTKESSEGDYQVRFSNQSDNF